MQRLRLLPHLRLRGRDRRRQLRRRFGRLRQPERLRLFGRQLRRFRRLGRHERRLRLGRQLRRLLRRGLLQAIFRYLAFCEQESRFQAFAPCRTVSTADIPQHFFLNSRRKFK
uniref:Uncharacterized protein n=1 Tax=Bactrocera dorsalis TaxID=27457 RepID=A0A034W5M2_BACDO